MTVADAPQEIPLAPESPPSGVAASPAHPIGLAEVDVAEFALVKPQRLTSLDVFRGITIAAMLLVNYPGLGKAYAPLGHAEWHGWTPTDLIFPFFLFIVGVAVPFSLGKRSATDSRGEMFLHIWARALSLVLLGLLLAAIPFSDIERLPDGYTTLRILRWVTYAVVAGGIVALLFPWRSRKLSLLVPPIVAVLLLVVGLAVHYATRHAIETGLSPSFGYGNGLFRPTRMRFPGVLQRIGVCYGVAATIALFAGWRTVLVSFVILCAGYSALMLKAPYHRDHVMGSLTEQDNLARRIDEDVFNRTVTRPDGTRVPIAVHTYGKYPDPEGILSTLPAIGSVLLGILVGYPLRSTQRTNVEKCARLLANGVLVTTAGVLLGWWLMPINKQIWTPSFTVFTAGVGMLTLGAVFYLTDVKGRRAWAWPFKVYGMNAIAAFVFVGILYRVAAAITVTDPATRQPVSLWKFCQQQVAEGVHRAGAWWQQAMPFMPPLDTPGNTSLAFAFAVVLAIFVLMALMYAFKVFLKV